MTGQSTATVAGMHSVGAATAARAPRRLICRFRRSQSGATAIEFGFVALPFLMLLGAVLEIALMFWTSQVLEEAVSTASRSVLTGQSQNLYKGSVADKTKAFRDNVCKNAGGLVDCSKLHIDVRSYASFDGAKTGTAASNPIKGGALDTSGFGFNQPTERQTVVARAVLEYKLILPQWGAGLVNIGNGRTAIVASTTFRAEPFGALAP